MAAVPGSPAGFDRARYRRVVGYFARVMAHMILWELVLRLVLGRGPVQRSAARRWRRIARGYRTLAVELGGVLIKLGQFLSVRVDVLPQAVTAELSGLQDEVPPVRLEHVQAVIEAEYQRPLESVFAWLASEPEAAASLAQVHRARLPSGEEVVVKVQRPGIETVVETDLRAIQTASRWLRRYRAIRRHVDLDRLIGEFQRTTRNELDFLAEARHAERFAEQFRDDPGVRIPRVYSAASTRRVLVMENVAELKIADHRALEEAGIDRREVARRLFEAYLRQVFVHNFVHADPHPGNLFVQPLPPVAGRPRPFRLVFVDFGMVATVPERVRRHIRDFLLGFVAQDGARVVRAYQGAGVLLQGADLTRLEEVETELLQRYSGLTMSQVQQVAMSEWHSMALEYRDLIYEMPFQFPTDLLFIGRAIAILFGMATTLDPDFDPWQAVKPFAAGMAAEEARRSRHDLLQAVEKTVRLIASLPAQADRFLGQANRGELSVRTVWPPEAMRAVHRVERALNRLAWAVIFAALLLGAVATHVTLGGGALSYTLFGLSGLVLLRLVLLR